MTVQVSTNYTNYLITDTVSKFNLVFFNAKREWLVANFPINEDLVISGKLERFNNVFQIIHPEYMQGSNQTMAIPMQMAY